MPIDISILIIIMGILFLLIFLVMFLMIFISFLRWFKGPRLYRAPIKIEDYMCPKCGSKDLEIIGMKTIKCRKCGTTFTLRTMHEEYLMIWPFFWWFPIIIPVPFRNK